MRRHSPTLRVHHTLRLTPVVAPPPLSPPLSRLCQRCGPLASMQKSPPPKLLLCYLLRPAPLLRKVLQFPLVSRSSMTALKRFIAISTAISPLSIFDCTFVCQFVFKISVNTSNVNTRMIPIYISEDVFGMPLVWLQ